MRTTDSASSEGRAPEGGEAASLTGAPAARRLYREVAADPRARLRVDLVGPGGSGKTVLLDALAAVWRRAGLTVVRGWDGQARALLDPAAAEDTVVLVDDAHELPGEALTEIGALATADHARLVVAHRPWPRPPALAAARAALARAHAPVVLGPLDRAGVAARATMLLGSRPDPARLDVACDLTGGLPLLVDRILTAWRDTGAGELPDPVVGQLRDDLDQLPDPLRALLLAVAAGAPADLDVLAAVLEVPPAEVVDLIDAGEATGLLAGDGTLRPAVEEALVRLSPAARLLATRRRVAETQLARGAPVLQAARGLLGSGATGASVAKLFTAAGEEALRVSPAAAGELFAAAVAAGAPAAELAARRAEAAAADGDLDGALELADQVLASQPDRPAERARAVGVAAAVLTRRGLLGRSAELHRWLAANGEAGPLAVPALVGTGALAEARKVLDGLRDGAPSGQPPTLRAAAEVQLAGGVVESVTGSPTAALTTLARSAALLERSGPAAVLPDTPAALAATVALHAGELDIARSVLERALAAGLGGPSLTARHQLLQAWVALQAGDLGRARSLLGAADRAPGGLAAADELVAAALAAALARRSGELPALRAAWPRAREALVQHPVDLFMLLPLGELAVVAARLGEQHWVAPHLDEAWTLLERLGDPPLWTAPLHWAALQAALAAGDLNTARDHTDTLRGIATPAARCAAAFADAAAQWLKLAAGEVDAAAAAAAARRLHAAGVCWEGARLAGQAAIRTRDRRAMVALLDCARALQHPRADGEAEPATPAAAPMPAPERPAPRRRAAGGSLSEREGEIARRVLAGLTYRQIGEQLFISPKTVEHHVAQLRRRFGATSRSELFAQLRATLTGGDG